MKEGINDDGVRGLILRLRTVRSVARCEGMTTAGIYARIRRGEYEVMEIDGVKFIVMDRDIDIDIDIKKK